ncbi:MAG: Do family serine endopeptidase [Rickettsiales bacterium]
MVSLPCVLKNSLKLALVLTCLLSFPVQAQPRVVPQSTVQMQLSFAPVAKKVAPAVVNIYTTRKVQNRSPFMDDPFFGQFFRQFGGLSLGERTVRSLGSGVIISEEGLVVTSHHVIKDSDEVKVVLADRREMDGKIILTDDRSDLALLRIEAGGEKLPYLGLRDSDTLEVGDLVLAIGNPFGVGQTVTSGIISALARTTAVGVADFQFFIQTDAAINPGNSGGALVDMDGNLIGVNTAIYSTSGASNGIGFAIPANMVRTVVDSAEMGSNKVVRPWLGVTVQRMTQDIAESLGLKRPEGVLIADVASGSPAAKAGLKSGDVVLSINAYPVNDEQSMHFRSAISPLNEYAEFTVLQNGQRRSVKVKMIAPPENPLRDVRSLEGAHPLHGVKVANLSPALAVELGRNTSETGVVVLSARSARLMQPGDVIVEINGTKINNTRQLEKLMAKDSPSWHLLIKRGAQMLNVTIR